MVKSIKLDKRLVSSLSPYIIQQIGDNRLVINMKKGFFHGFLHVFLFWIYPAINILIAFFEIIIIALGWLDSQLWFIPLLHFILLFIPYWFFIDQPPYSIEITREKLIIKYKKLIKGYRERNINIVDMISLRVFTHPVKGGMKWEIRVRLRGGKDVIIFRKRKEEFDDMELVAVEFAGRMNLKIE